MNRYYLTDPSCLKLLDGAEQLKQPSGKEAVGSAVCAQSKHRTLVLAYGSSYYVLSRAMEWKICCLNCERTLRHTLRQTICFSTHVLCLSVDTFVVNICYVRFLESKFTQRLPLPSISYSEAANKYLKLMIHLCYCHVVHLLWRND